MNKRSQHKVSERIGQIVGSNGFRLQGFTCSAPELVAQSLAE
jgi:hypothetical protein